MNTDILWSKILEKLQSELKSLTFTTWFKDTELYKLENNKAYIIVPMPIHKKHLNENYSDLIINKLYNETNTNYDLYFFLKEEIQAEETIIVDEKDNDSNSNINVINTDLNINYNINSNLNKNYTFESFIVGNSNKFAQTAALSVAEYPGSMYNPLFIYGNSGLGKTHLMHAIGNYIVEHSNRKVLYITSEEFMQDYRNVYNNKDGETNFNYINFFNNKYRNIDVLIIDDIQLLSGPKSQESFFNTFNTLFNNQKQIIISSDRSPNDLKKLEDRLMTRFSWGLTVNIFPPDFELKKNILKNKIKANNFQEDIPDDVIDYIANNIGPDVRQLEGAINRLLAYASMWGSKDITLDLAIEALTDVVSKGIIGEKNDIHRIQRIVSEHFQISVEDIRSKKRSSNISFPRQIAMYLCRTMTPESFPKIGIEFGGKDHSTVMHSVEKIEKDMKTNKELFNLIEKLKKDIGVVN